MVGKRERNGIAYYVQGNGPPLLMLHGLAKSSRYWLGFDNMMGEHFRVLTPDARGLGESSSQLRWRHGVKGMAEDALAVLEAEGLPRAHVLGVSLGGMIAINLALHHPSRVQSLTIINSSLGGVGKPRISLDALRTLLFSPLRPSTLITKLAQVILSPSVSMHRRQLVRKDWERLQKEEGIATLTACKQFLAALAFRVNAPIEPTLFPPSLILTGADDLFVPTHNSEFIAKLLPRSQLQVIRGAGHEPYLEQPEFVRQSVIEFVRSSGSS